MMTCFCEYEIEDLRAQLADKEEECKKLQNIKEGQAGGIRDCVAKYEDLRDGLIRIADVCWVEEISAKLRALVGKE